MSSSGIKGGCPVLGVRALGVDLLTDTTTRATTLAETTLAKRRPSTSRGWASIPACCTSPR